LLLRGVSGFHCRIVFAPLLLIPLRGCKGSASVENGNGIDFAELVGCDVVGVVRCDALVTRPHLDVTMFSEEEPTTLKSCPAVAK
jgi:hypothetical protein